MSTKELSAEERNNRSLDFLGGFSFIDNESRVYVIEGRGGPGNSVDRFYRMNERERPNDHKFKMLYNPNIKYSCRLYQDFNCVLKVIKIRGSLSKLVSDPDIYLRDKV